MSRFRYQTALVFIAFFFLVIIGKLFQFQVLEKKELQADRNSFKEKILISRGEIVDRDNKILAVDLNKYTLEYNPVKASVDNQELFEKLSRIIAINNPELLNTQRSVTLAHNLTKKQADAIKKLGSPNLYIRKIRSRVYPQGTLASHLVGYVDLYGKARQGVESNFEEILQESPDSKVVLSIDSRLQNYAEKILEQRITDSKAARGTVMVMKVGTGELLAWAVKPDFDPNAYYSAGSQTMTNWSLVDVYQPGSVFKTITVASALDSLTIDRDYTFTDEGFIKVDNWKIKNHDYNPKETEKELLDLKGLFANSSNPFSAHLALKMGPEIFYNYIRSFGFGTKTGLELAGESSGIVHHFKKWRKSDTATTGLGQGAISVTPIQVLAAVNAIANNGFKVKPTILKVDSAVHKERVVLEDNARYITKLLAASIKENIVEKHAIAGNVKDLEIAGKTGTAQKLKKGGGYSSSKTVASFVGYFPVDAPRYIVFVVLDDPQTDGRWGDTIAGPVFNQVAAYIRSLYL